MMFRAVARVLSVTSLVCLLTSPRTARADDATTEMARQRFREGVGFYDQRQYEKARLAFLQAYALKPHPSILLNLAQSELRGDRPADAAGHFSEYLKTNSEASDAEKQEAELGFAAAKSKVGEVTVAVDAAGAQIGVDGDEKGTSPLAGPLFLVPGSHTIDARSGDKHATKTVNATAGQTVAVSLTLRAGAAAAPPPPPAASSKEEAAPEPKEPEEEAEPEEKPAPAEASASGEVSTGGGRKNFFSWWVSSPGAIAFTGVGVVGLGLGVTFAALSHQDYANADSYKNSILTNWQQDQLQAIAAKAPFPDGTVPCALPPNAPTLFSNAKINGDRVSEYQTACKKFDDAKKSGDSRKTVAIVSSVIGGVGLVGTVVYYFVDPNAKEDASASGTPRGFRAHVAPWTGGGVSGLTVYGSF